MSQSFRCDKYQNYLMMLKFLKDCVCFVHIYLYQANDDLLDSLKMTVYQYAYIISFMYILMLTNIYFFAVYYCKNR